MDCLLEHLDCLLVQWVGDLLDSYGSGADHLVDFLQHGRRVIQLMLQLFQYQVGLNARQVVLGGQDMPFCSQDRFVRNERRRGAHLFDAREGSHPDRLFQLMEHQVHLFFQLIL